MRCASMVFALLFILPGFAFSTSLPDTGQTKCYNNSREIACPNPGEDFYGQDAQYITNSQSYTKLDENGNDLPDEATEWVMVRDNVTGLVWEGKTDDDSIHDKDNNYDWYDAQDVFIATLNSQNFGGSSDWRLPTIKELDSLVNSNRERPAINTAYFPYTRSNYYWSSTTYAPTPQTCCWAWYVSFSYGDVGIKKKAESQFSLALAVRGEQSGLSGNFIDNNDGTVTDTDTGLMWQQSTAPGTYTWQQALYYCENLSLAEYQDWRLPNRNELQSIRDYNRYDPAIDPAFNVMSQYYWSSTTATASGVLAETVSYFISTSSEYKTDYYAVRAVRGEFCAPFGDADDDTICDNVDNCIGVFNPLQFDCDNDGIGDVCDPDTIDPDGDGLDSACDNCPEVSNEGQADGDGDDFGDICDECTDTDGDGYGNPGYPSNTCPLDNCPSISNISQTDSDGDGFGDVCDQCPYDVENDIDGDGVCGDVDNCPAISNPGQEDADADGLGDACDEDDDNDTILDEDDNCHFIANVDQIDSDRDGMGDVCDVNPYYFDLLTVVDGHYVREEECCGGGIGGYCNYICNAWSTYTEILLGRGNTLPWPNPPLYDRSVGAMEFSLSSAEGLFTSGLISAELSLTVKNGSLNSACPSLYDVADDFENGVLGENEDEWDYNGGIGDFVGQVCTDLQSGTVITFDVTASLEHDLFAPDQSDFAGFVLYPTDFPEEQYIEFYDHTDPANGPRLIIIRKDSDDDGISNEEDNCPEAYNPDQADIDGDCIGDACDPAPNDPDNPVIAVDADSDEISDACDNCPNIPNSSQEDTDRDGIGEACDNCPNTSNSNQDDTDSSGIGNACNDLIDADSDEWEDSLDNCPNTSNTLQEDSYPPQGNGIGDACDCEGDFACDGDVDGIDASTFKADFGRSVMVHPCIAGDMCNGDFSCDGDVDGTDASLFKQDFGRSSMQTPCPACVAGEWCGY
jgi:hypothetical protein